MGLAGTERPRIFFLFSIILYSSRSHKRQCFTMAIWSRTADTMLTSHTFSLYLGPTPFDIHHDSHKLTLDMLPDHCTLWRKMVKYIKLARQFRIPPTAPIQCRVRPWVSPFANQWTLISSHLATGEKRMHMNLSFLSDFSRIQTWWHKW